MASIEDPEYDCVRLSTVVVNLANGKTTPQEALGMKIDQIREFVSGPYAGSCAAGILRSYINTLGNIVTPLKPLLTEVLYNQMITVAQEFFTEELRVAYRNIGPVPTPPTCSSIAIKPGYTCVGNGQPSPCTGSTYAKPILSDSGARWPSACTTFTDQTCGGRDCTGVRNSHCVGIAVAGDANNANSGCECSTPADV